jgi:hypothetical protein
MRSVGKQVSNWWTGLDRMSLRIGVGTADERYEKQRGWRDTDVK